MRAWPPFRKLRAWWGWRRWRSQLGPVAVPRLRSVPARHLPIRIQIWGYQNPDDGSWVLLPRPLTATCLQSPPVGHEVGVIEFCEHAAGMTLTIDRDSLLLVPASAGLRIPPPRPESRPDPWHETDVDVVMMTTGSFLGVAVAITGAILHWW